MTMQAPVAAPGGPVVPPSVATFEAWLAFGSSHGWVSEIVCETHGVVPMTPQEDRQFNDGFDPCVAVVRVWPQG